MKKIVSLMLVLVMLAGCCSALGQAAEDKYDLLRVGVTTPFSGNFFSDAIGNNISDQDVRKLIHSYNLIDWDRDEGIYRLNQQAVASVYSDGTGNTYMFVLSHDLTYNDGTPITAKDYAFSFLLQTSRQLQEATGLRQDGSRVLGWQAYDQGEASTVTGFRVIGNYQISITMAPEYTPYFYELKALDLVPMPAEILAPGCEVADDGAGIYLRGSFGANVLEKTLLDPATGYASHPTRTCGPYTLEAYDGQSARLTLNPNYKGDAQGEKPRIPTIEVYVVDSNEQISALAAGKIDLAPRAARQDLINSGRALSAGDDFSLHAYARNGLGFISFCAEKGPTADATVRQAISMCLDKETLVTDYLGAFGVSVKGYYGIGQWMFLVSNGTLKPGSEDGEADEVDWDALNLDGLKEYELDVREAAYLFDDADWWLNEQGDVYDEATGGVRYKSEGGKLVPLKLKLIYPEGNEAGPMLEEVFAPYLAEAGAELEIEAVPMPELLEMYYGQAQRDCDMIMLGTNFSDVFEPSRDFDGETNRLNGITDETFLNKAVNLRTTEPGDAVGFVEKWISFLEYRTEIVPEIPLYSNTYIDFSIAALRNYEPSNYSSWGEAVQYAYLSDYEEEEEEEEMLGDEDEDEWFAD